MLDVHCRSLCLLTFDAWEIDGSSLGFAFLQGYAAEKCQNMSWAERACQMPCRPTHGRSDHSTALAYLLLPTTGNSLSTSVNARGQ